MSESSALVAPGTPIGRRRWRMSATNREAFWGYVFVSPWIVGLLIFGLGPLIASFFISLTDFNLVKPEAVKFVGLDNYAHLISDPLILQGLLVTAKFAIIAVPVTMIGSLAVALLVNSPRLFGRNLFRTLFYMPIQIPLVASTLVWLGYLNTQTGWLNAILRMVGLTGPDWLNSEVWVYPALTLIGLWGIGNFMLISLAGLQSVPTHLYEAARLDGAGPWAMFRHITIPMMSPILLYNLVICLITTLQYFVVAYVLTNGRGDPNNSTLFINLDLYREAFTNNKMGYGAAIGWMMFVIVLILTIALLGFARKRVYYAGGES